MVASALLTGKLLVRNTYNLLLLLIMSTMHTVYDWQAIIKNLRSELYLMCTQEELAHLLGASTSAVAKWESGNVEPQTKFRRKIRELALNKGFDQRDWPKKDQHRPRIVSN